MKILFLGYPDSSLVSFLKNLGETVVVVAPDEKVTAEWVRGQYAEFMISYGYLHILKRDVLSQFPDRAINLHIAYLPWNRGKDPNFWSFIENSPKGVTIHHLNEGVDTGDIIVQKEIFFGENETLKSSYAVLRKEIENLFFENWHAIKEGSLPRIPQPKGGSFHLAREKEPLLHLLTEGWDTSVKHLGNLKK